MNNNLGQKILETIKEKTIKPAPKWQFLLKNYLVWTLGIIALVIGSFSIAVILHMLINNDWDIYQNINNSLFEFILITLPYFWLIFLSLFILVAHYNIKHTKKGYRLNLFRLTVVIVAVSILLGGFFYSLGFGQMIDNALTDRLPFYRTLLNHRKGLWLAPERGFLSGMVTEVNSPENFKLIDINRKRWNILLLPDAQMPGMSLEPQLKVKILGQEIDNFNFEAHQVIPELLKQRMFMRTRPPQPLLPPPEFNN